MGDVGHILYGAAYYEEYLPADRKVEDDVAMMRDAHLNVVRIAESTWSTLEPQPGVFDFSHVDRTLDAVEQAGISVIVGTPTYAVPSWLVQSHPEVLAETAHGPGTYGARQIMDIASPTYRFFAERVIRRLAEHTAGREPVIGFQLDNETKYYGTVSRHVQRAFVKQLRERFDGDLDELNRAFGLAYWSNRVDAWEDFPDVRGAVNGSLAAAFDRFRRSLVTEFLGWQAGIVREYARPDQFLTQNFDFDWAPGWSYGLQPAVDHFQAAETVDVVGTDIYHPGGSRLTGKEIAFGGDLMRSVKRGANYFVLETQAQGQNGWLPYPGQLRLQAFSHLASGADAVMYWHWHSIHNSFETYWRGLLSHDFEPNPTYREAAIVGGELERIGDRIIHLQKSNRVAVMVSNDALTALEWFGIESGFPVSSSSTIRYNDVLRWLYDALFDLNVECDFVSPDDTDLGRYDVLLVPALYAAPGATFQRLRDFVASGGHLLATFRTAVADENVTVWHDRLPHGLVDVFGLTYNQFTKPDGVQLALDGTLADAPAASAGTEALTARALIELLQPTDAEAVATYQHSAWGGTAAITRNVYGSGSAWYVGTMTGPELIRDVLTAVVREAGIADWGQELAGRVAVRRGRNAADHAVTYLLNYSGESVTVEAPVAATSVLSGESTVVGAPITIGAWDLAILEE